jgi:hypothetical protein
VIGERGHLGEVTHGQVVGIGLPVGIGGKGCGGIPGEQRGEAGHVLRIPGKEVLETLDEIHQQERDEAKEEHGGGVLTPVHFFVSSDATQPIEDLLNGTEEV